MFSERILSGTEQQTQGSGISDIIPEPVEEHIELIAHSQNGQQVDKHPHKPSYQAAEESISEVDYSLMASDSRHGAFIFIMERRGE